MFYLPHQSFKGKECKIRLWTYFPLNLFGPLENLIKYMSDLWKADLICKNWNIKMERYINYCRIFFISSLSSNNFKYNWLFEIGTINIG